jgi:hypothetical protein
MFRALLFILVAKRPEIDERYTRFGPFWTVLDEMTIMYHANGFRTNGYRCRFIGPIAFQISFQKLYRRLQSE